MNMIIQHYLFLIHGNQFNSSISYSNNSRNTPWFDIIQTAGIISILISCLLPINTYNSISNSLLSNNHNYNKHINYHILSIIHSYYPLSFHQIQYHNQTLSILCYSYSCITAQRHSFHSHHNSDPQLRHSTLAHFIDFTPHSLSFISHYSTIFYYHLFIPIQYYWIQSREYHSHHSLLISFISYFHLYLHSHIISILFISHNSSTSLSHSLPITSICYHFINSHPFISSSLIVSYDCCWL